VPDTILQVISADHRRGAEVYAVELRDELRRLGRPMELVALRRSGAHERLDVPTLGDTRFAGLRELRARVRASRVVIAHGSDALPATAIATAGTRRPFVYRSIGDPRFWSHRADRRLRVGFQLRRAAAVATTFPGAAHALVEDYGLDEERVVVIPNGRRLDHFPLPSAAERQAARAALIGPTEASVVAVVGALAHEKAPERAVRAVAQLPEVQLLVVGDGPGRAAVERYAAATAPGRVHLVGALADPRPAYLAADVALIPSRTEGFPGVAIEAGLSGIPVVATDVGGVPEVVIDGETGVVVSERRADDPGVLAAAIRGAIDRAGELGAAGRARCESRFDLVAAARAWDELLDRVLRR
jgi:glycosyltransferase involved in cell wall biosynthesis